MSKVLLASVLMVSAAACVSVPVDRGIRKVPPPDPTRWSGAIVHGGSPFRFELGPALEIGADQGRSVRFAGFAIRKLRSRSPSPDRGEDPLYHFLLAGRTLEFRRVWDPRAERFVRPTIWVYRPPAPGEEWVREEGGFTLVWREAAGRFCIEERLPGESHRWFLGKASVELLPGGEVRYRPDPEGPVETLFAPKRLVLDRDGADVDVARP